MTYGILLAIASAAGYTATTLCLTLLKNNAGALSTAFIFSCALIESIVLHLVMYGRIIPENLLPLHLLFLCASGILGYVFGFFFMIKAIQLIGPRLVLLITVSTAVFSFFLGWIFLGETPPLLHLLYAGIVISGIILVIMTGRVDPKQTPSAGSIPVSRTALFKGIFFAFLTSLLQAVGLLLSKFVLSAGVTPVSVNTYRLAFAAVTMAAVAVLFPRKRSTRLNNLSRRDWFLICLASVLGPVSGNVLLFLSLRYISIGISSSMLQLSPVFMLFISRFLFKERIRLFAIGGTLVAITGTVLLTLK